MNLEEAEQWLAQQPLTFPKWDAEDKNPRIPNMMHHFKDFGRIPSQEEFVESYMNQDFGNVPREYVLCRVSRTYPSLVRDWHLRMLLEERFGKDNVYHSKALDTSGVDFKVTYKGETFYIHAFVDTPRSWHFHRLKRRKVDAPEERQISFALRRDKAHALGEFYVYTQADVDFLIEQMEAQL